MKVYVIEVGCYSDRHVIGVVETKEEAEHLCGVIDDSTYAEFDTNQFKDGRLRYIVEYFWDDWDVRLDSYGFYENVYDSIEDYEGHYVILANSPEQAVKIAQDMRAQKQAMKSGIDLGGNYHAVSEEH